MFAGAVIAAAALVLEGMTVPAGALAIGVPASIRPEAGLRQQSWIKYAVQTYLDLAEQHGTSLRRLDLPAANASGPAGRRNDVARTTRQLCAACRVMRATIHHAPQVGRGTT